MIDSPCYKCEDRCAECHSKCKKYIEWKAKHNERREKIQKEKDFESWHKKQIISRVGRMNNRRR